MTDAPMRFTMPDLSLQFDLPSGRSWHLRCPLSLLIAADRVQAETQGRGEPDDYSVLHLLPVAVAEFGAPADLAEAELQAVLDHAMAARLQRQQARTADLERLAASGQGDRQLPSLPPSWPPLRPCDPGEVIPGLDRK